MRKEGTMRNAIVAGLVGLILTSTTAAAQEPETVSAMSTDLQDYGGFLGLDVRFGDMSDEFAAFVGAHGALLLKHRVYLGMAGYGLATDEARAQIGGPDAGPPLEMGYGGLLVGYVVPTPGLVQLTVDALLAGGGVKYDGTVASGIDDEWDGVFVFEPNAGLELKLARILRLGFGAGYRLVGGVDTPGLSDDDLRGVTGTARIRVGWF
jgi:hypothetical protein